MSAREKQVKRQKGKGEIRNWKLENGNSRIAASPEWGEEQIKTQKPKGKRQSREVKSRQSS